ncbi:helicase domain-containing protein [Burkholderia sp. SJ98]|nr:helicase domain-containing protein [Burkholderia sp. SJ98]
MTADIVRSYIDFDGHDMTQPGVVSPQARIQSEGVAGLWHLLVTTGFAYLGDEVGMGKTRQAMGVIATQFLARPDSRIVIVCSSATMQRQWESEWSEFLRTCYRLLDDRLIDSGARQIERLHAHDNLRDFVGALRVGDARIHLLRYSSFSRPLTLHGANPQSLLDEYTELIGGRSYEALTDAELDIGRDFPSKPNASRDEIKDWKHKATHRLAHAYSLRIGRLLTEGEAIRETLEPTPNRPVDLVIFDESQYLRHIDNQQNTHIAAIFRHNANRWLFMSATPLHSRPGDIKSLDTYLCRRTSVLEADGSKRPIKIPVDCRTCDQHGCSRATMQLDPKSGTPLEVVDLLGRIMIRRTRTYADLSGHHHGKVQYRKYERIAYSGNDDPFLSMTMALVQKRLAGVLAGRNNRFRQGECASFESLSASVRRLTAKRKPKKEGAAPEPEFEPMKDAPKVKSAGPGDEANAAPDRTEIDKLAASFASAMTGSGKAGGSRQGVTLPHAKLNRAAEALFDRSLVNASNDKTLVFVRRIDSVEELRDLMHARFQDAVDRRIGEWRTLLDNGHMPLRGKLWDADSFWGSRGDDHTSPVETGEDDLPVAMADDEDEGDEQSQPDTRALHETPNLPYFEALKRASGTDEGHGKLVSFWSRLLSAKDPSQNPLRAFLLKRPDDLDDAARVATARYWTDNAQRWDRFLVAVLGEARVNELLVSPPHAWLFADTKESCADAWKLAALQLCLLQSMRQTDFIVDLYILHTHVLRTGDGETELADKLIWLLEHGDDPLVRGLAAYIGNWKEKFRRWIEHFDLIVDKAIRAGAASDWKAICRERVHAVFRFMSPVVGRSGRLKHANAVAQFNLPVHPNVLICTDVLKEGVNLHLFCDKVMHYGVAWTSGDLEQRTGRIDRLGSLIGRRIARYAKGQGTEEDVPRLDVSFPYLEGTLDRYQVERVIRDKIASDLRMDLGKRKEEIGELDVGKLGVDDSVLVAASTQATRTQGDAVFFPESARFVRITEAASSCVRIEFPDKRPNEPAASTLSVDGVAVVPLPALDCMRARRVVHGRPNLLRYDTASAQAGVRLTEEFLAPMPSDVEGSPAALLADAPPSAVPDVRDPGFVFDASLNTLVCEVDVSFALTAESGADGKVMLESIGDEFWLLRSAVCAKEAILAQPDDRDLPRWLSGHNRKRRWGYMLEDHRVIWFAVMVRKTNGAEWRLLTRLSRDVARLALYYRSLVANASALKGTSYRSPSAFPALESLSAQHRADRGASIPQAANKINITIMKTEDLIVCGQVLTGVTDWFTGAFDAVFDALYQREDDMSNRRLVRNPLEFLDGGVLCLSTSGQEHFSLQAFLDLNGAMTGNGLPGGPKMLWELAASPNSKGQKPSLPMSALHQFPHSCDAWEGSFSGECSVFTWQNRYRFVAVYHKPEAWDRSRGALLDAWRCVLDKMQALSNFQRKGCRDAFIEAIGLVDATSE